MDKATRAPELSEGRVAMLVALPRAVWTRIRDEAREVGVGPSKLIEPVLLQAFGCDQDGEP